MHAMRVRPVTYFAMGIAVTGLAVWTLSAWQASAGVSADESTFVAVAPTRILDTREDIGLDGPFVSPTPQYMKVTGAIETKSGTLVVVPEGATGVMLNVTVVGPTAAGFVSIRPADAPGPATTSNLNFSAGDIIPNAVTVQTPTSGGDAGEIQITYNAFENAGPTTELLIDLVGYTKNAGLASLQAEVDQLRAQVAAATAPNTVGQDQIAPGGVGSSEVAPGAINNTHIVSNSLTIDNLGPNSVGASEIVNGTVGMTEMGAIIVDENPAAPVTTATPVAQATCSADIAISVPGVIAGSRTLVLGSRLQAPGENPGWIVTGGSASTANTAFVKICNETATAGSTLPPPLLVSFIILRP